MRPDLLLLWAEELPPQADSSEVPTDEVDAGWSD